MGNIIDDIIGISDSQHLSQELKDQFNEINRIYHETERMRDVLNLLPVIEKIPSVLQISQISRFSDTISNVRKDRELVQTILKIYAVINTELDNQLYRLIQDSGPQVMSALDSFPDGGFRAFAHMFYYNYPESNKLKRNKYIGFILTANALIVFISLTCVLLLLYYLVINHTFAISLKGVQILAGFTFASKAAILVGAILCLVGIFDSGSIYAFLFCSNPIGRFIRQLFVGRAQRADPEVCDDLNEDIKDMISIRIDLSNSLSNMIQLVNKGQYRTHYLTYVNGFEVADALTRGSFLTAKDKNMLITLMKIDDFITVSGNRPLIIGLIPVYLGKFGVFILMSICLAIVSHLGILNLIYKAVEIVL